MIVPRYHLPDSRWPRALPKASKRKSFEVTPVEVANFLLGIMPGHVSVSELYSENFAGIRAALRGHAIELAKKIRFPEHQFRETCSLCAPPFEPLLDIHFQKQVMNTLREVDVKSTWLELFHPGGAWEEMYYQRDDVFDLVVRQTELMPEVLKYLGFLGCGSNRTHFAAVPGSKESEWLAGKKLIADELPDIYSVLSRESPIIVSLKHDAGGAIRYPATIAEISLVLCVFMKYRENGASK